MGPSKTSEQITLLMFSKKRTSKNNVLVAESACYYQNAQFSFEMILIFKDPTNILVPENFSTYINIDLVNYYPPSGILCNESPHVLYSEIHFLQPYCNRG